MRRYVGPAVVVCAGLVAGAGLWRGVAARGAEPEQQAAAGAVHLLPAGQRLGGTPGQKGATYYALAARTRRLTTRFSDAVAVAETGADGDVHASLRDAAGRETAHLLVNHLDSARDVVQFSTGGDARFQALGEPGLTMTMEWANRQVYSLAADGVDASEPAVEWRAGLMRRRGAAERDLERAIVSLETEWDDGLAAVTSRLPAARRKMLGTRESTGEVLVTRLTKHGQSAGAANWFPREQVFTWSLPGLTTGGITAKELADYGGWRFTPDFEWMNIQAIAFHHFKTLIDQQRFVARAAPPRPGLIQRAIDAVVPTLHADEPGCDGLHWLDGTIFRYCCDIHDACYAKYGCTSRSWWQFWSSWRCTACNAWVVDCFTDTTEPIFLAMG